MTEEKANYNTEQTIFRVEKSKDNPFVMMDRRPLEKPYLSWKAKGLLAYLLSRPDNWVINFGDLVKRSTEGEHATRTAAKELIKAGHIKVDTERDNNGKITKWTYTVYEQPLCGFQDVGNQDVGNCHINNTKSNEKNDNDITREIKNSANKTVDAILENERIAQEKLSSGAAWPGREKMPEPIRELLDTYVKLTGQRPTKGSLMDWLSTGQDWLDLGIIAGDLEKAYKKSKGDERGFGAFTVGRPGGLTSTANMFAGERRLAGKDGNTNKYERAFAQLEAFNG
jgi:hypothetical protein